MANYEAQNYIVTNGLVLNLDAGDPDSYTRSQPPYVEVLVVAGGAGGGRGRGGGGGAGGLIYNSAYQITNAAAITVTVGAGGAGGSTNSSTAPNGSNSVFGSLTAIGGGGGAGTLAVVNSLLNGASGGSGGGGSGNASSPGPGGQGGTGTAGQGFVGGTAYSDNASYTAGGGGGGAGGPGNNSVLNTAGSGAAGQQYSISGTPSFYAAGGGGGGDGSAIPGSGGSSIGGNGSASSTGGNATTNTGAGGGGGAASQNGGNGGSGIVIVRYPGLPAATGGTIAYLNGYTIHTFTTSGTFTPNLWNSTSNNSQFNVNNGTSFTPYLSGGTFDLDGTDDYFLTGSLNLQQNWTLEIWANMDDDTSFGIFGQGITATNQGLHILYTNGGRGMIFAFYSNDNDYENNYRPTTGVWYHWVFTYNVSTYDKQFYADSILQTPGSSIETVYSGTGQFNIGATYSSALAPANGKIAVTRFYNRVLSQAEITQNYNALRARFGK